MKPSPFASDSPVSAAAENGVCSVPDDDNLRLATRYLDALPDIVFLLDDDRRVAAFNQQFPRILRAPCPDPMGMRFGEIVACSHAGESGSGCGHEPECDACGAAQVIAAACKGNGSRRDCSLLAIGKNRMEIVDLSVEARPVEVAGRKLILLSASDMTDERRRRAMEKLFFDESLAISARLGRKLDRMAGLPLPETAEDMVLIQSMFAHLIEEIEAQKELLAAENNELQPRFSPQDACELVGQVEAAYRSHERAEGKTLAIDAETFELETDPRLVRRILGNMLKNALEATNLGDRIVLMSRKIERNGQERAVFSVVNPGIMPRSVQLQIFNRSFSTKSAHRGLGTYSMKLLSTRYLHGDVGFSSHSLFSEGPDLVNSPGGGFTTFFLELPLRPPARTSAGE